MKDRFNYRNTKDLPLNVYDYILAVSGADDVHDLDVKDINDFLNDQEEWYNEHDV
tara:strand:+ start:411 stop:575 length:165 start_codon:yes stop_codon:yes gene_type:complete